MTTVPDDQRPPGGKLRLGDKWLEFVGEGSANTIWAVHFTHDSGGDEYTQYLRKACNGFLLRIQKYKTDVDGSDSSFTAEDQISHLRDTIIPRFNNDSSLFVTQEPVHLTQAIIDEANAVLSELDEKRSSCKSEDDDGDKYPHLPLRGHKFCGSRIGPEGTHMLAEDFRPRHPRERFAEIKPKWLAQSPTAPRGATTCRNCAVSAKRYYEAPEGKKPAKSDPEKYGCPLYLVNPPPGEGGVENETSTIGEGDDERRDDDLLGDWKTQAERIFRLPDPRHSHFLFQSARKHHLLQHLKALQNRHAHADTFMTTTPEEPDEDLLLAMTLRDCSLFFRFEVLAGDDKNDKNEGDTSEPLQLRMIDFKLADLDRKTAQKIPSWQETERGLIEGGWYEGKEGHEMPHCFLKRGSIDDAKGADFSKLKNGEAVHNEYKE